jgi:hypothetical protein
MSLDEREDTGGLNEVKPIKLIEQKQQEVEEGYKARLSELVRFLENVSQKIGDQKSKDFDELFRSIRKEIENVEKEFNLQEGVTKARDIYKEEEKLKSGKELCEAKKELIKSLAEEADKELRRVCEKTLFAISSDVAIDAFLIQQSKSEKTSIQDIKYFREKMAEVAVKVLSQIEIRRKNTGLDRNTGEVSIMAGYAILNQDEFSGQYEMPDDTIAQWHRNWQNDGTEFHFDGSRENDSGIDKGALQGMISLFIKELNSEIGE